MKLLTTLAVLSYLYMSVHVYAAPLTKAQKYELLQASNAKAQEEQRKKDRELQTANRRTKQLRELDTIDRDELVDIINAEVLAYDNHAYTACLNAATFSAVQGSTDSYRKSVYVILNCKLKLSNVIDIQQLQADKAAKIKIDALFAPSADSLTPEQARDAVLTAIDTIPRYKSKSINMDIVQGVCGSLRDGRQSYLCSQLVGSVAYLLLPPQTPESIAADNLAQQTYDDAATAREASDELEEQSERHMINISRDFDEKKRAENDAYTARKAREAKNRLAQETERPAYNLRTARTARRELIIDPVLVYRVAKRVIIVNHGVWEKELGEVRL